MTERQDNGQKLHDPVELSRSMARIAEQSQRIIADFMAKQTAAKDAPIGFADPVNIGGAFLEMTTRMMADPAKLVNAQMQLWQDYATLWQNAARRFLGETEAGRVAAPGPDDRRFKDPAWEESHVFDFIKQSYLLTARWLQATVRDVEGLDQKTSQKVDFYTRQFVDAMAPSNFILTDRKSVV